MIDRRISPAFEAISGRAWFVPSFLIQEYLLPQINVGKTLIAEYGDTAFTSDDRVRLKGNIEHLLDAGIFDARAEIRFDPFEKDWSLWPVIGSRFVCSNLYEAADQTARSEGTPRFYGDRCLEAEVWFVAIAVGNRNFPPVTSLLPGRPAGGRCEFTLLPPASQTPCVSPDRPAS